MTPAHTVIGAIDARMKASTDGTPSRSRASARDTGPGRAGAVVLDIGKVLLFKGPGEVVHPRADSTALSAAAWVWAISSRRAGGRGPVASATARPGVRYWPMRNPSPHPAASPASAASL